MSDNVGILWSSLKVGVGLFVECFSHHGRLVAKSNNQVEGAYHLCACAVGSGLLLVVHIAVKSVAVDDERRRMERKADGKM